MVEIDPRLTDVSLVIARLRRQLIRTESEQAQAAIWKVIKHYQELQAQGIFFIPKF